VKKNRVKQWVKRAAVGGAAVLAATTARADITNVQSALDSISSTSTLVAGVSLTIAVVFLGVRVFKKVRP